MNGISAVGVRIGESENWGLGFGRKMEDGDGDGDGLRCSVNGGKREWNTLFTRETTRFALCFIGLPFGPN
jgi:hypothetical protein